MADKPKPHLRLTAMAPLKQMPPNNEHRTAAERHSFAEMLKDALDG